MPNLIGFLLCSRRRIKIIFRGKHIVDKFRLFLWALLDSIPRTFMRLLPLGVVNTIKSVKYILCHGANVNTSLGIFRCVDEESLIILSDEFEPWIWNHFKIPKNGIFIDVGAHIGKYAIAMAKVIGDKGLVIAVEPHPENFSVLTENISLNHFEEC